MRLNPIKNLSVLVIFTLFLFIASAQAREWTIMVYMCGDNGMNDQVQEDLSEMIEIGSTPQVQIIAQVDNLPSDPNPTTRRYRIEQDTLKLIADLGEKDMADLNVVLDYIRFCRSTYPANNYCLILWDHGSGWYPTQNPIQRSIIYDYTDHDSISVAGGEFNQLMVETRRILGKKLNLLVMDACLMGEVEVAYEAKDGADIMVASEALVPLNGLPYEEVFTSIVTQPELTPKEFAQAVVRNYANSYNGGSQGFIDVTFSAVDLTKLETFSADLDELIKYLKNFAQDSIFITGRSTAQTFPEDIIRQPRPNDDYIDLYDFLIKTQVVGPGRYERVLQAYDSLIVAYRSTGTYYPEARGLSTWFPDNYLRFKQRALTYQNLGFAQKTGWLELLNQYYHSDDIKPAMTNVSVSRVGSRNNFSVYWDSVYDFAGVTYELTEIAQDSEIFSDKADSTDNWNITSFTLSTNHSYSPYQAFFSGNADTLNSKLELKNPISIPNGGLLSFFCYYNTEENIQNGGFKRDILFIEVTSDTIWRAIDSLYGTSDEWTEFRYLLDNSNNYRIRFSYRSDSSVNLADGGAYIDNIKIIKFGHKRTIVSNYPDTSFAIFNVAQNIYHYVVTPIDGFGNKGMVSQFSYITVKSSAEPYSKPNPFFSECNIFCDYPTGEEPKVYIYTLSGELVKKFEFDEIKDHEIYWNGKNWNGKEAGSGIYLVLVKSKNFAKLGKIAKVK
jgi:hypothetical protein